jgi:hypothetical protein
LGTLEFDVGRHLDDDMAPFLCDVPQHVKGIEPGVHQEQQPPAHLASQDSPHQGAFARAFAGVGRKGDVQQLPPRHGQQAHQSHLGKGCRARAGLGFAKGRSIGFGVGHRTRAAIENGADQPMKIRWQRSERGHQLVPQHSKHLHTQLDAGMTDRPVTDQLGPRRQDIGQPPKARHHPVERLIIVEVTAQGQDQHQPDE